MAVYLGSIRYKIPVRILYKNFLYEFKKYGNISDLEYNNSNQPFFEANFRSIEKYNMAKSYLKQEGWTIYENPKNKKGFSAYYF